MNILYASTLYPPAIGGSQMHLHCMAKVVQSLGHGVQVATYTSRYRSDWLRLTTYRCETPEDYSYEGIPVSRLGFPRSVRMRMVPWASLYYFLMGPAVRRIAHWTRREMERIAQAPSVVHVTRNGREFLARACLDLARQRGIPFVVTPNHHPRWRGVLYRQWDRVYREADAVIALTPAEKRMLVEQKGVRPERIHVTGTGPILAPHFSAEGFRRKSGIEGRIVLFVGQQLKYKGIGAMAEAAPIVWGKHPDVRFVFIGPPTPYSEKLFGRLRDPRLVCLGNVDVATKTSALAACTILCLPSVQESFGIVYAEAWSHRKPVIGCRIPAVSAVIDEGRDGLLTRQEPQDLAAAIVRLLDGPQECEAMGRAGWRKVQEHFNWETVTQRTLDVYRSLGAADACPAGGGRPVDPAGTPQPSEVRP